MCDIEVKLLTLISFFLLEIFIFLLDKLRKLVTSVCIYYSYINHVSKKILTAINFPIWLDQ